MMIHQLFIVLMGDGELQEGQNWEAIMYASAKKVDNIIAVIDLNGQQIDGSTEDVLNMGNLNSRLNSFGWKVIEIDNGNDIKSIIREWIKQKIIFLAINLLLFY